MVGLKKMTHLHWPEIDHKCKQMSGAAGPGPGRWEVRVVLNRKLTPTEWLQLKMFTCKMN